MNPAKSVLRNKVIWLGESPPVEVVSEFERRWLFLHSANLDDATGSYNSSRAIIIPFRDSTSTPRDVRHIISDSAAFNFGLIIVVIIPKNEYNENYGYFDTFVQKDPERIKIEMDYGEAAQVIFQHNPGPSANDGLTINGTQDPELSLLLQRAFWNCKSITLNPLTGGSTSKVYRADVIQTVDAGPAPLPFFVKFDIRKRILRENTNYAQYVEGYIPFNHRPNIVRERCVVGANKALLVGNFVEHSESLGDVAHRGTFTPAVYSLFHQALRNWHGQAIRDPHIYHVEHREYSMKESLLKDNPNWPLFPNDRIERAVWEKVESQGYEHMPAQLMDLIASWPKCFIIVVLFTATYMFRMYKSEVKMQFYLISTTQVWVRYYGTPPRLMLA